MNLDLVCNIFNEVKNNKFVQNFIKELQNYLDNNVQKGNFINAEKEDITLLNTFYNEDKIITKYRDKMLIERSNILNNYASETINKGEMYYIYSKNSKMENAYNLCICEETKSNKVIELDKNNLPEGAKVGSVLRKTEGSYILDEEATEAIEQQIYNMKNEILKEQTEFLKSCRIEEHIYEMSEKDDARACLFDITSGSNEEIEEIDFPLELLKNSKEGDLFIYKNGEYQKYL